MPLYICPAVAVDKVIMIGPESFNLPLVGSDDEMRITPPSAHTGIAPVNTRLISARFRSGQTVSLISIVLNCFYRFTCKKFVWCTKLLQDRIQSVVCHFVNICNSIRRVCIAI